MAILGDLSMSPWPSLEEIECNFFLVAQRRNYASKYLKKQGLGCSSAVEHLLGVNGSWALND